MRSVLLPAPRVAFEADFLARLGRFGARVRSAAERREGAGRGRRLGVGAEFVGYRPYRPGDDPRRLDWGVYARSRRPFVRVTRREASEAWGILLDTSASMGTGAPGKLQRCAEVAIALASVALRLGASVRLRTSSGGALTIRRAQEIGAAMAALEREEAAGSLGLGALLARGHGLGDAGRVFLLGDLFDLEPSALRALARRGREVACAAVLAPAELAPPVDAAVQWVDPEDGGRASVFVDARTRAAYETLLTRHLDAWRSGCARHRVAFGCWSSLSEFEDIAGALLDR